MDIRESISKIDKKRLVISIAIFSGGFIALNFVGMTWESKTYPLLAAIAYFIAPLGTKPNQNNNL